MSNSDQKILSICILNFNSGKYLVECLRSLDKIKGEVNFDIFVGDNNSFDNSLELAKKEFPKLTITENKENLGFSKGYNILLKKVKTPLVLLLNPDSKVLPGTLKYMTIFMEENPEAGAASCKVEKLDKTLDWASHRGFPTPWASFKYFILNDDSLYHLTNKDMNKVHEVDSIVGAFFITRKKVLEEVEYFDEDYFLYAEDIDLCFRIKKAGYKIYYVPEVKTIHLKGVSSGIKEHSQTITQASKESRVRAFNSFYSTMILFYKKNLAMNYPFFINWLVYLGIYIKWFLAKRKMVV